MALRNRFSHPRTFVAFKVDEHGEHYLGTVQASTHSDAAALAAVMFRCSVAFVVEA